MVNGAGLAMATMDIIQLRRKAVKLLRCRWRCFERKSRRRLQDHLKRSQSESDLGEHFGGIMNCADLGGGDHPRGKRDRDQSPPRRAHGGNECRRREKVTRKVEALDRHGRWPGKSCRTVVSVLQGRGKSNGDSDQQKDAGNHSRDLWQSRKIPHRAGLALRLEFVGGVTPGKAAKRSWDSRISIRSTKRKKRPSAMRS